MSRRERCCCDLCPWSDHDKEAQLCAGCIRTGCGRRLALEAALEAGDDELVEAALADYSTLVHGF